MGWSCKWVAWMCATCEKIGERSDCHLSTKIRHQLCRKFAYIFVENDGILLMGVYSLKMFVWF